MDINKDLLNFIEGYLLDKGCEIEDYEDPLRGISQMEAIFKAIDDLVEYKYMYFDLCK